jgi:hypothetical protein
MWLFSKVDWKRGNRPDTRLNPCLEKCLKKQHSQTTEKQKKSGTPNNSVVKFFKRCAPAWQKQIRTAFAWAGSFGVE